MKFCVAIGASVAAFILCSGAVAGQTTAPANTGDKMTPAQRSLADASLAQTITETADIAEQSVQLASTAPVDPPAGETAGAASPTIPTARVSTATGNDASATIKTASPPVTGSSSIRADDRAQPASPIQRQRLAAADPRPSPVRVVGKSQTGRAAWYGGRYVGRQTTSGERLDTIHATAAHRTLPLNTLVRVTNLKNGRSVVARITDRGPISTALLIDMSPRAADELNMRDAGVVPVRVEQVVEVPADQK
jgi:rare lipoprotein A